MAQKDYEKKIKEALSNIDYQEYSKSMNKMLLTNKFSFSIIKEKIKLKNKTITLTKLST